jgi:hypothetical protein
MGRPRKNVEGEGEAIEAAEATDPADDTIALPELKDCPACNGRAEVKKDIHDLFRCFCQTCGFWDCGAHLTPLAAAESWNASGGPNPVE